MAEYPGAARAAVSPNRSPRQGRVQLFIVHHYAGTQDPESAWRRFNAPNDRSVSPNYQVNADGSVFEVVPPDRYRAWTTGAIDHQAVTCETQNTSGAPSWGISRASHEAIAALVAWASRRYGFPIQRGAVADGNRVTRPGVVGHRETPAGRETSTACPGPSMNLDWLVNRAQQIAGGSTPFPTPTQEEDEDMPQIISSSAGQSLVIGPVVVHLATPDEVATALKAGYPVFETSRELHNRILSGFGATLPERGFVIVYGDPNGTVYTWDGDDLEPIYDPSTIGALTALGGVESVTWSAGEIAARQRAANA